MYNSCQRQGLTWAKCSSVQHHVGWDTEIQKAPRGPMWEMDSASYYLVCMQSYESSSLSDIYCQNPAGLRSDWSVLIWRHLRNDNKLDRPEAKPEAECKVRKGMLENFSWGNGFYFTALHGFLPFHWWCLLQLHWLPEPYFLLPSSAQLLPL